MNTKHRTKGSAVDAEPTSSLPSKAKATSIQRLLDIMASLRGPGGCPWDQEQSFETLLPFLQEESAEYIDAVREGDPTAMQEELGDVLLQVVFHAQIAAEKGLFDLQEVSDGIADKLYRRHPHVFGDVEGVTRAEDVERVWAAEKEKERVARGETATLSNPLARVPRSLEPLPRAYELSRQAAKIGFDWDRADDVVPKVREELDEVCAAESRDAQEEELGDLLFAVVNLCRKLAVRPDQALARANAKFERRFEYVLSKLTAEERGGDSGLRERMEVLWNEARAARVERQGRS